MNSCLSKVPRVIPHLRIPITIPIKYIGASVKAARYRSNTSVVLKSETMPAPVIHHSVNAVLEILTDDKFKDHVGTQKVLNVYNDLLEKTKSLEGTKKYPLIVVEGLDGCGKSTLTRKLAKKINGTLCVTPPKCISGDLRETFDFDRLLRTAYYAMGNYVTALEMCMILQKRPVVLDRYWHSTAAYAIGQAALDFPEDFPLPPKGSPLYNWPSDLMKPDMVILLSVSEKVRLERHSRRKEVTAQEALLKSNDPFRESVLTAYKNMEEPNIHFMNGDGTIEEVLDALYEKIKHLL